MRDQEKWRDRVELSLDGRQIFLVFAGAAVTLTFVFVLGIVVGKRLQGEALPQVQTDPLALLDQLSAGEQDQTEALSFPEALTGGRPTTKDRHAQVTPSAALAAAPGPAPALAPMPAPVPAAVPAPAPAELRPQPKAGEGTRTMPVAALTAPTAAGKPAAGGYTLQVSAFQNRGEAQQFLRQLESRGLRPQLVQAEVPERGTWYRVRLGRYQTWEQAVAAKTQFERSNGVIAYVARN